MQVRLLTPALLALFIALSNSGAYAQNSESSPSTRATSGQRVDKLTWNQLTPLQQTVLAPLENDWETLSNDRKTKWLRVANRYPYMTTPEQERLQSRMAAWAKLPQKDRRLARDNYLSSLQFPPEQKAAAWEAYQQLSEEEKQKLAQQEQSRKKTGAVTSPAIQTRQPLNSSNASSSSATIK
jgi:hypothetical protein